jgi:hypothetical protein
MAQADYILKVMLDENLYNEHLAWKNRPFPSHFLLLAEEGGSNFVCQLADAHAQGHKWKGTSKLPQEGFEEQNYPIPP